MSAREPHDTPVTVEDLLDWLRGVVDRDGVDETLLFRLDPSPLVLREPDELRPLTIIEVMREPIVSYTTTGDFEGEEQAQLFETGAEAIDAARMMDSGGASNVTVERTIVRVVRGVEPVEWRDGPA